MLRWLHHIASFCLFLAAILLLVVSVSSPVAHKIGFLKVVNLSNSGLNGGTDNKLVFGNWGLCIVKSNAADSCTKPALGYNPIAEVIAVGAASGSDFSSNTQQAVRQLTRSFVLHPIACGLSVLAFIIGSAGGLFHNCCAALTAALNCVVILVAMAIDFWLFSRVRSGINDDSSTAAIAQWASCIWLVMVAFLLSFVGMLLMLLSSCSSRDRGSPGRRTSLLKA